MLSNIHWVRGVWLSFFPLRLLSSHGTPRQWGWYTAPSSGVTLSRKSQGDSSVKSLLLTGNVTKLTCWHVGKLTCFLKSSGVCAIYVGGVWLSQGLYFSNYEGFESNVQLHNCVLSFALDGVSLLQLTPCYDNRPVCVQLNSNMIFFYPGGND